MELKKNTPATKGGFYGGHWTGLQCTSAKITRLASHFKETIKQTKRKQSPQWREILNSKQ